MIDMPLSEETRSLGPRRMRPDPSGKPAVTRWQVLGSTGGRSWLALYPLTGRTHQLRVHCAASGWPIVGDLRYGGGRGQLLLHARRVVIPFQPRKPSVVADAPPPADLAQAIRTMEIIDDGDARQ